MTDMEQVIARKYAEELREIAGMLAQQPDGQLRWKRYRIVAISDFLSSILAKDTQHD